MRKIILTVLATSLMAASTVTMAAASERHHVRKVARAPVSQQFRNANNAVAFPAQPDSSAGYAYHGYSAPAGR